MSGHALQWKITGACVRGAGHLRRGMENQDALAFAVPDGIGESLIAAVSDGHGAPVHFRAAAGSALAVKAALQILTWNVDSADGGDLDDDLAGDIVTHWLQLIHEDAAAAPLSADEVVLTEGRLPLAYGATLIALRATGAIIQMLQIGDGDLLAGYPDGRIERPLRADEGLQGEETFSLCLDGASRHFRTATLWREEGRPWPDFLLLATDGVSKSYNDEPAFREAVAEMRSLALEDWDGLCEALPGWLEELSAYGSGDDSTLCLALRANAHQDFASTTGAMP